jgi:hypothetical protein
MSVAAVLTYVLSQALHLPLPLWAVLISVIVTQMSVGKGDLRLHGGHARRRDLQRHRRRVLPHAGSLAIPIMLAIAVAPLALLAAPSPRFTAAPFTAVMVLLFPR